MGLIVIDAKIKFKRSTIPGVVPVIGVSDDHTDGSWTSEMIYPGELFVNIPDQRVWIGINAGVLEIFNGTSVYPSLAYADQPITPGIGERTITLPGDADTDALGIYNLSNERVALFAGDGSYFDKQVLMNQTLNVVKSVVFNDTLNVKGLTSLDSGLGVSGHTSLATLYAAAAVNFNTTLDVFGILSGRDQVRANVTLGAPITLRDLVGSPTVAAIYGFDVAPSSTNYRHFYNAGTTSTNASTTTTLQTAGLDRLTVAASGIFTRTSLSLAVGKGSAAHSMLEVSGAIARPFRNINAATTLTIDDFGVNCNSSSFTVTLPTAVGIQGREYLICNQGNLTLIQIVGSLGQRINGENTWFLAFQGAAVTVVSDGNQWYVKDSKQRSTLNVIAGVTGATFQHNELLGARSISMTNKNGTISQGPFTFVSATGTITMAVTSGNKITVFYNPQ